MRSKQATWFECKIRYEKTNEEGLQKKVTEQYTVDALSFSEAEHRITEEMSAYISGEYEITDVKKAPYKEVFFSDDAADDRWYRAKLMFITIDEKTEKEKRSAVTYLVQAATLDGAVKHINDVMDGTMIDYEKSNISETKIIDVFEYEKVKSEELLDQMASELFSGQGTVTEIVDKYVHTATPELRQQLIEKLTAMRNQHSNGQEQK